MAREKRCGSPPQISAPLNRPVSELALELGIHVVTPLCLAQKGQIDKGCVAEEWEGINDGSSVDIA